MDRARHAGDPLPAALAAYLEAVDAGRFADAAACFAADAAYAVPRPGVIETAPRLLRRGRAEVRAHLDARGVGALRDAVTLCTVGGRHALVEGVATDAGGSALGSFVASVRFGADGLIERYLAFACPGAREPLPGVDAAGAPADAARVIDAYFADLDGGRPAAAAAHFSPDVLYSHPPYAHTGITDPGRIEFRGRTALEVAFVRRGTVSFGRSIGVRLQAGSHCLFEGGLHGLPGDGSFIASVSLAADGTIRRYLTFLCEPAVPLA